MIKCPCCTSADNAIIGNSGTSLLVSYQRCGKKIAKPIIMRLCMNCGTVYVAKKNVQAIKQDMEAKLKDV